MRAALIPLLLLTAAIAVADDVSLDFGSSGERLVFAAAKPPEAEPEGGTLTRESTLVFSGNADQTLYVWDRQANRVASRPLKGLSTWSPKAADFKDIGTFTVVVDPARPVRVSLKDARRTTARLADDGKAAFFFVKPGRAEATVEFNQDGKPKTITQIVDVAPDGTATVALPGGATKAPETATGTSPSETQNPKPKTQNEGGSAGNIFAYLIGLAVVGGIGYTALRYYQGNKGRVDDQLEKLGVQVPKPQDAALATADPLPAVPKKPDPPAKIVLDDAAPTPLASAPIAAPISIPRGGGGIWLAQGADRVDIPDGETVVGREPGLGLSLVGENSVSRHHATLMRMGDTVTLIDNGSTNGTFVNGAKVTAPTVLRAGDEVRFGQASFRFGG